ncbi:MAG TPA: hypothetical protein H9879_00150 [Candidatus Alistipes intestinipullorum]|nr:hypothetical protein [Candidatus Alistipes intestinipullorum]
MKRICFLAIAVVLFATAGVRAQEQDDTTRRLDSLQQVVNRLTSNVETLEQADKDQAIWKDRAKYFNIGYVNQKLLDKSYGGEIKSDLGVSLSNGKTYYLHKKPLAKMIKFGIDFSWLDINYAKYTLESIDEGSFEVYSTPMHQAEIGMQVGPSVTINPIHHLKVGGYFRVTPSYSMLYMDDTFHHHYVTFCNAGCTVAWKIVSLGVEWRWGTAKYDGLTFDESAFEGEGDEDPSFGDVMDQLSAPERKFKTSSVRFYIGFRF